MSLCQTSVEGDRNVPTKKIVVAREPKKETAMSHRQTVVEGDRNVPTKKSPWSVNQRRRQRCPTVKPLWKEIEMEDWLHAQTFRRGSLFHVCGK